MTLEEAKKLKEYDCVLLAAFVQKPSCGKVEDGSVLDKFGTIQLSAPSAYGDTVLRVLPEQVVSRCPAREGLKVGDFVLCNSERGRYVGFAEEINENVVVVKLAHNSYLRGFFKSEVSLIISSEELQERIGRAIKFAEKKRAYAKGGLPELEKMIAGGDSEDSTESNEEGGEA